MSPEPKLRAIETLWSRVTANPSDDAAHEKLISFAAQNDLFVPVIERYKQLEAAGHKEIAERWKKRIADVAMAKVFSTAAARRPPPSKTKSRFGSLLIVIGVTQMIISSATAGRAMGLVLLIAGLGLVFLARGRGVD